MKFIFFALSLVLSGTSPRLPDTPAQKAERVYDFGPVLNQYHDPIMYYAQVYNVDPLLIAAIIWHESKGKRWAKGPTNDMGLMQVVPKWHMQDLTPAQWFHPWHNINRGTKYLAYCLKVEKSLYRGISCYNMGPRKAKTNHRYVQVVLSYYNDFRRLNGEDQNGP